ncbi:MAG: aminoglycoside phosphotransferase family protein [Paracoccaceae bacterium]
MSTDRAPLLADSAKLQRKDMPKQPDAALLAALNIQVLSLVERTAIATVWQVQQADGTLAALKVYPSKGMGAEGPGFDLLAGWDGQGAARLYGRTRHAALIEWLDGPSLGDLTRAGRDAEACRELVQVAMRLHAVPLRKAVNLPDLSAWFAALFTLRFAATCPPQAVANLTRCKVMARALLADPHDVRPLHGDLHHDNIRLGTRGYLAFDAKGVLGERSYELANAFRNPKGAAETVGNPARIKHLASSWSSAFNVPEQRLLTWATVKCALSIAWRCKGTASADDEFALLSTFLRLLDESPAPTPPIS